MKGKGGECSSCGGPYSGASVEIRDNYIHKAWLHKTGEFDNEADIYLVRDGGVLVAMPEWRDHFTPAVHGCSEWRLVVPFIGENGFLHFPASEEDE